MSEQKNSYRYLEWRPHRWRKTPYTKGRNLPVSHLLCSMWANEMTPEEVARDYELSVEAVYEALDYYEKHQDLLEAAEHLAYCSQRGYPILTRNARDFRRSYC